MKKIISLFLLSGIMTAQVYAQDSTEDKTKRPSPPATVTQKITSGATITINYGQPSIKGRVIGKDVEPKEGEVWRTGANEATTFTTDKDITINGAALPAGKYGFFTLFKGKEVALIFNKISEQWGAFKYNMEEDILRANAEWVPNDPPSEKLIFTISPSGEISFMWGDRKVSFTAM